MIEVNDLTKRYGNHLAVDSLNFVVQPGIVTGFLGPNGAGKSTTMRLILGLDHPTRGSSTVNGLPYREHKAPMTEIGALLEAKAVHPSRPARDHLRALAATTGISTKRVDEVLELVGLTEVASKSSGGFSLGMGQRLGIASALLGDPRTVMLDEPVNGLDPEGILWIRNLLKSLADEGRTVFVSSHLMTEMALMAEHFIVIGKGKLIADVSANELAALTNQNSVRVRCPQASQLRYLLQADGVTIKSTGSDVLEVTGMTAEQVGTLAWGDNLCLQELTPMKASLEDIFLELTHDAVEYHGTAGTGGDLVMTGETV
ncbi:MAG TPA: ATP-binding cassette domain-containing protein [Actinomycetota bacterium]|nr:ATP-binding cassette domain-containing protein [Actinomycetota bacterium]